MRIDTLKVQNFKKFRDQTFELDPQFTLFVGENGAGKTSVLDALAVALGVWLVEIPDTSLHNSRRNIMPFEISLTPQVRGDRVQFRQHRPVSISAQGQIGGQGVTWVREITLKGTRTSNAKAKAALKIIHEIYEQDQKGASMVCPVLAYYGAGRAWLPSHERASGRQTSKAGRWAAFYDCFEERIRFADLRNWFQREAIEAGNRGGQTRPGFDAVRQAILGCVPGCDGVHFDADQAQIVLSIKGDAQPFDNLSAGQRMMLALVADIAIKAVTQNAHLLPHPVLAQTPGVVLIDELDVHLHPSWQRRVATDLQRTFPLIQFVCTSHSPQVIGELPQQQVRLLDGAGRPSVPAVARGADSNWILDHVLVSAASANAEARRLEREAETALEADKLDVARDRIAELRQFLQGEHGTLARLESSLATLRALAAPDGDGA